MAFCAILYFYIIVSNLRSLHNIIKSIDLYKRSIKDTLINTQPNDVYRSMHITLYDTNYRIGDGSFTIQDLIDFINELYAQLEDTCKNMQIKSTNDVEISRSKAFLIYHHCNNSQYTLIMENLKSFFASLYSCNDDISENMDGWYKKNTDNNNTIHMNYFANTIKDIKPELYTTTVNNINIDVYSNGLMNNDKFFCINLYHEEYNKVCNIIKTVGKINNYNCCQAVIMLDECFKCLSHDNPNSWFYDMPKKDDIIPFTNDTRMQPNTIITELMWSKILSQYNKTSVRDPNYKKLRKFINMHSLINESKQIVYLNNIILYIMSRSKHVNALKHVNNIINDKFAYNNCTPIINFNNCNHEVISILKEFTPATIK